MSGEDARAYRGLAARANYLAQDRPEIQYAVKEAARRMSSPAEEDWLLLKRLGRYLVGAPRVILTFEWQETPGLINGYSDSDWAGCTSTRRSTSGGALLHGAHCVKTWSTTQATVALSSAEAELYALLKTATQALGMIALARDLGIETSAKVHTDASATLGIVARQGLGKLRHIGVQYLWIQDKVKAGDFQLGKIEGAKNPADLMTKHLSAQDMLRHMAALRVHSELSRAAAAPKLSRISGGPAGENNNLNIFIDESEEEDYWQQNESSPTEMVRIHAKPRRALFTPLRVSGAPPGRCLTPARVTKGVFINTGEPFSWTDTWTARSTAHQWLKGPWMGSTTFLRRSKECE